MKFDGIESHWLVCKMWISRKGA